jgi:virginiamycin B lyase
MKAAGGGESSAIALAHERRRVWLPLTAVVLTIGLGALLWHTLRASDAGFVEYRMPVRTDIPTALAVAPDAAVWFTLEFSDAIGVFRDGRIERLSKGTQNLEPLGLAVDRGGHAWYTDAAARAISRVAPDGTVRSFPLSTPIARLGRLALAPDGAVWFADATTSSVTRLRNGAFARHEVRSLGASPFGVAVDAQGTVWTTLQGVDKLARIPVNGQMTELEVPTRHSGLGDVTVDRSGAVWFVEIRVNQIGRFADGRFTEFPVPTSSAGLITLAAAPDGAVWFTELRAGQLGRLRDGRVTEFRIPREGARPFGVAVDTANNVWYTDLSGWLGMLPAARARSR